jgi:hypothetical protein
MRPAEPSPTLTTDQRLCEAAAILARAILRLRHRAALGEPSPSENLPNSAPPALEDVGEIPLTVHTG